MVNRQNICKHIRHFFLKIKTIKFYKFASSIKTIEFLKNFHVSCQTEKN